MEPRMSLITLGVEDLERILRLPTTWGTDKGVIFFQTQGICLARRPRSAWSGEFSILRVVVQAGHQFVA